MNILQLFNRLIRESPQFGLLLLSVLGIFAVIAVTQIWKVDIRTSLVPVAIIFGVFLLIIVMNTIARDQRFALILSWFCLALVLIYPSLIVISAVFHPSLLPSPPCLLFDFDRCEGKVERVIDPPPPPTKAASAAAACTGVDISVPDHSAPAEARWCGTGGATRTTEQQAQRDASCVAYKTRPYAGLSQNELYRQAKTLAKAGEFDAAYELIDTCQCHNPKAQAVIREGKQRMLCFLRAQD